MLKWMDAASGEEEAQAVRKQMTLRLEMVQKIIMNPPLQRRGCRAEGNAEGTEDKEAIDKGTEVLSEGVET
jgi:hypothetical protein